MGGNGRNLYGCKANRDRRFTRSKGKRFQIQNLWERHHEILNLVLLGWGIQAIADRLDCSRGMVSDTVNSDLGRQKLAIMRAARDANTIDVAKEIQRLVPQAYKIYGDILYKEGMGENASIALQKSTADTIVKDLAGHEAPKKMIHAHLTVDQVEGLKKRGRAIRAAKEGGMVEDVEEGEIVSEPYSETLRRNLGG